jgi:hypothetical protein
LFFFIITSDSSACKILGPEPGAAGARL